MSIYSFVLIYLLYFIGLILAPGLIIVGILGLISSQFALIIGGKNRVILMIILGFIFSFLVYFCYWFKII